MRAITSGDFTADSVDADRRARSRRSRAARSPAAPRARGRPRPPAGASALVAALVLLAAAAPAVVVRAQHRHPSEHPSVHPRMRQTTDGCSCMVVTSPGRPTPGGAGARCRSWCRAPWPGSTSVSAGRVKSRRSIDSMIVLEVAARRTCVLPGPPGKRVSPLNRIGWPSSRKHMEPGVWPGVVDGAQPQVADLDHRRRRGSRSRRPGASRRRRRRSRRRCRRRAPPATAWMWSQWPWVVSTRAHAGRPAQLEQQLVLVGGVDEHGVAGALAAHDEHVVLERPDDQLVDPHRRRSRSAAGRGMRPGYPARLRTPAGPGSTGRAVR